MVLLSKIFCPIEDFLSYLRFSTPSEILYPIGVFLSTKLVQQIFSAEKVILAKFSYRKMQSSYFPLKRFFPLVLRFFFYYFIGDFLPYRRFSILLEFFSRLTQFSKYFQEKKSFQQSSPIGDFLPHRRFSILLEIFSRLTQFSKYFQQKN